MTLTDVTPEQVQACFTDATGAYRFARWGRPIAPVVFGVDEATLGVVKGALEAMVVLANHKMSDHDPEFGANLLMFFLRDWDELAEVSDMDHLLPDLPVLLQRLNVEDANQYRLFRFDEAGAIKACFCFIRMDDNLQAMAAEDIALAQAAQMILLWGNTLFRDASPLARDAERSVTILRPDIAAIVRAAYDPTLPGFADDAAHALRLYARLSVAAHG